MFSIVNGKRVDSHIHDDILKGISPEDDHRLRMKSYERAIKMGFTPQQAAEAFGVTVPQNPLSDSPDVLS